MIYVFQKHVGGFVQKSPTIGLFVEKSMAKYILGKFREYVCQNALTHRNQLAIFEHEIYTKVSFQGMFFNNSKGSHQKHRKNCECCPVSQLIFK